jgi:predicted lipid-binding transport protein (Tim44 family)
LVHRAAAGDADAARAMYQSAVDAWTELDVPLQRALTLIDRARLLDGAAAGAGVTAEVADAVAAVEALGAGGLLPLAAGSRP